MVFVSLSVLVQSLRVWIADGKDIFDERGHAGNTPSSLVAPSDRVTGADSLKKPRRGRGKWMIRMGTVTKI